MKSAEELFRENTGSFPNNRTAIVTLIQLKSLESDAKRAGMIQALKYVLAISNGKRALRRVPDFLVALDEIDLHCEAAIERLGAGEDMGPLATTQSAAQSIGGKNEE